MKRTATALLLLALAPAALAARSRAVRSVGSGWHEPRCESVQLPWLRFIDPNGERRESSVDPEVVWRMPLLTTEALAIGATPNVLWAVTSDGAIRQSKDAGCTWAVRAVVPEALAGELEPRLLTRHPERVYAYHQTNIVRLTGATIETFTMPGGSGLALIEVDRRDSLHLRAITKNGFSYESFNGAANWGPAIPVMAEVSAAAIDPQDFDHIIAGGKGGGLRVSRDGGKTWKAGADGPLVAVRINDITFSPADSRYIWVDVWAGGVGDPSRLYTSADGGETYTVQGANTQRVFFWGQLFAPHPRDAAVYATHGGGSFGIRVLGPGIDQSWSHENVKLAVWSPSGTLYFVRMVIRSL